MLLEEPEDLIVMLEDYKYGDPLKHGKGHRKIKHMGKDAVLMPGKKVWRVRRRRLKETGISQVLDNGAESVVANQQELKLHDMETRIWGSRAVGEGMSIESLFGSNQPQPAVNVVDNTGTTSTVPSQGASSSGAFSFDFAVPGPNDQANDFADAPTKRRRVTHNDPV